MLNLWALNRNGWANDYYSAAVRSMSSSWHNFLYDSFDPSGLMTVDKPPLALWVQALSARVFGFHSWSILVPQALMGVATVALVYDLTRRLWGRTAGFVAGLVLAVTPITVAISRYNNPDALLALCCVGALWCLVRALQDGRTRWIVLAGVCVGLGFETKMGAALLVVPAIVAAWMWVAPARPPHGDAPAAGRRRRDGRRRRRVAAADDAHARVEPPVDLGHERQQHPQPDPQLQRARAARRPGRRPADHGRRRRPGGGTTFGGATGPLRLLNEGLGGQAGWLLGFALVAIVALAVVTRLRRADARTGWLIATGGMFLTIAVAFSFAQGIFHPYYVAQLAPFTAALVGAGAGWFLSRHRAAGLGAAVALAAGVATELLVLHNAARPADVAARRPARRRRGDGRGARRRPRARCAAPCSPPPSGCCCSPPRAGPCRRSGTRPPGTFPAGGPAQVGFGGGRRGPAAPAAGRRRLRRSPRRRHAASAAPPTGTRPAASARGTARGRRRRAPGGGTGGGGFGGDNAGLTQAVAYAKQHGGGAIAVSSQSGASASIIQSGANVAGIGGFSGRESQVTATWLADAVRSGRVRWVLTSGSGGFGGNDGRVGSSQVMAAVAQVGRKVTITSGSSTTTLYDLSGRADALAAAGS